MPIPNYLNEIAYDGKIKNNFTEFSLKCTCGCELFDLYENYLDKKEKKLCKPYYDALTRSVTGGYYSSVSEDENGNIHHWIHFFIDRNWQKEEVFIPPAPVCAHIFTIKIKCSECGKEYIIYDSRYNGYDGKFCSELSNEEINYW